MGSGSPSSAWTLKTASSSPSSECHKGPGQGSPGLRAKNPTGDSIVSPCRRQVLIQQEGSRDPVRLHPSRPGFSIPKDALAGSGLGFPAGDPG